MFKIWDKTDSYHFITLFYPPYIYLCRPPPTTIYLSPPPTPLTFHLPLLLQHLSHLQYISPVSLPSPLCILSSYPFGSILVCNSFTAQVNDRPQQTDHTHYWCGSYILQNWGVNIYKTKHLKESTETKCRIQKQTYCVKWKHLQVMFKFRGRIAYNGFCICT